MRIFIAQPFALYGCRLETVLGLVAPLRRTKAEGYLQVEDVLRSLAAGLLLRGILGVRHDADLRFGRYGKPYLARGSAYFSLAHSGDCVALSVSGREHGMDVEHMAPLAPGDREATGLAGSVMGESEYAWHQKQGYTDSSFYRIWTGKESVMKESGFGVVLPPRNIHIELPATDALSGELPEIVCGRGLEGASVAAMLSAHAVHVPPCGGPAQRSRIVWAEWKNHCLAATVPPGTESLDFVHVPLEDLLRA